MTEYRYGCDHCQVFIEQPAKNLLCCHCGGQLQVVCSEHTEQGVEYIHGHVDAEDWQGQWDVNGTALTPLDEPADEADIDLDATLPGLEESITLPDAGGEWVLVGNGLPTASDPSELNTDQDSSTVDDVKIALNEAALTDHNGQYISFNMRPLGDEESVSPMVSSISYFQSSDGSEDDYYQSHMDEDLAGVGGMGSKQSQH